MIAIITGTIEPSEKMGQLVLRDANERFRQYRDALCHLLNAGAFSKVVFCENSNYGTDALEELRKAAKERKTELELFSFRGDQETACRHGKGYGEGESMCYVLQHSRLLQEEDYFVKLTGRLWIHNIKAIAGRLKEDKTYFNIPNRTRRDIYDTRLYAMKKEQFIRFFLDAYREVNDEQGMILEKVYTNILVKENIYVTNFPQYPRITGISGSHGSTYGYSEWKCKIKDVVSRAGGYKVRK